MMTTVNEVKPDKTKIWDEFIFHGVSLVCFTAKLSNPQEKITDSHFGYFRVFKE